MTWEAAANMRLIKQADPMMRDPAASPVSQISVNPTPAPGMRGPKGMSPRQNTSQVNSGAPPIPDAGSTMQKSVPPNAAAMLPVKTAQISEERMTTMAARPSVHDMIKAAMAGSASKVSITSEAAHQLKLAEEKCETCKKEPCTCKDKKASSRQQDDSISTEALDKLASALEYAAGCVKEGAIQISGGSSKGTGPGAGPNALRVMEAQASTPYSDATGQAKPGLVPPVHTGLQKGDSHAATQLENNEAHAPGGGGSQQVAMVNQKGTKTAAPIDLIRKLAADKEKDANFPALTQAAGGRVMTPPRPGVATSIMKIPAAAPRPGAAPAAAGAVKQAEDAINPAHITAGKAVEPDTREAGQAGGVAPKGGQPSMVGSSQAAIGYTKGQAKAEPKRDLSAYLSEPALSAAHDHVLQNAFSHSGQAGVKMSSDATVKTAAARALLAKLVESVTPADAAR